MDGLRTFPGSGDTESPHDSVDESHVSCATRRSACRAAVAVHGKIPSLSLLHGVASLVEPPRSTGRGSHGASAVSDAPIASNAREQGACTEHASAPGRRYEPAPALHEPQSLARLPPGRRRAGAAEKAGRHLTEDVRPLGAALWSALESPGRRHMRSTPGDRTTPPRGTASRRRPCSSSRRCAARRPDPRGRSGPAESAGLRSSQSCDPPASSQPGFVRSLKPSPLQSHVDGSHAPASPPASATLPSLPPSTSAPAANGASTASDDRSASPSPCAVSTTGVSSGRGSTLQSSEHPSMTPSRSRRRT